MRNPLELILIILFCFGMVAFGVTQIASMAIEHHAITGNYVL